jgi:hypothetical protein
MWSDFRIAMWVGVDEAIFLRADARSTPVAGLSELGVVVSRIISQGFVLPTK